MDKTCKFHELWLKTEVVFCDNPKAYGKILLAFCRGNQFHASLSLRRHAHGPLAKRLMHMLHLSGNTSEVSKLSPDWLDYTRFPGDVCVTFFNVLLETQMLWHQNPSRKKKATVFTNVTANAYQSRLNAGFSKVCEIFKVCAI